MSPLGRTIEVAGVSFDHGLSKRQLRSLEMIDPSTDPKLFEVFPSAGIPHEYSNPDALIKANACAVLLHPNWGQARQNLDSSLLDLTITPDDDFDDPDSVKVAMAPVCVAIATQQCVLGESHAGLRHRITAARFLGFGDQLGSVPPDLVRRVGNLFSDSWDFERADYNINRGGRELIRPLVPQERELIAGWHPDPWAQGEYRMHNGEKWQLEIRAYGQEFADRVGADTADAADSFDPTVAQLYRLLRAWFEPPRDCWRL